MNIRSLFSAAIMTSLAFGFVMACSGPDKGELERKVSTRASPGSFRSSGVTTVLEKRCGSLDCHGGLGRNLRIYSSSGLRLPSEAGLKPGAGETTIDEITANYQSVMTLEPEATNAVVDGADPYTLLVVKKPLDDRHLEGAFARAVWVEIVARARADGSPEELFLCSRAL